ncbi:MAG: MmcQ/YjbR family DNA-binding protein [Breznakibacter sp.]|nr:MmcQ/YjbR family DNA-binding protein [Breznakibacter sp.]
MNIEELREYCLSKPLVGESFPFDATTLVFKVADKMFALIDLDDNHWVNLKCDPNLVEELRDRYAEVLPGYHMHKKHWNTVRLDGALDDDLIRRWIDDSYALVVKSFPVKKRAALGL